MSTKSKKRVATSNLSNSDNPNTTPLRLYDKRKLHVDQAVQKPSLENDSCNVKVDFIENLSAEQVVSEIGLLQAPQIIVWYAGCYGLRETSIQFYRDSLISPILKKNKSATFWLVDLTAWGAFKNPKCKINSVNSICDVIEKISHKQIKCIRSASIFKKMQEIADTKLIQYFKKALARKFISQASKHFPDIKIPIKQIFTSSNSIISNWNDCDASKSYSVFQYFEGCLLVEEIFKHLTSYRLPTNYEIVFALPNDELKYYFDPKGSFEEDIRFLISSKCKELNINNLNLKIKFLSFRYGECLQDRPYNAPGKTVKAKSLVPFDIIGATFG